MPNFVEINIAASTKTGEIGTDPSRVITLKILGKLVENGKQDLVDLPITLFHECTNVELKANTDALLSYQYLKDGTKQFTLSSFVSEPVDINNPNPPATVNCFLYSLAQELTDSVFTDTDIKMTSYPNLSVGPTTGGILGTSP